MVVYPATSVPHSVLLPCQAWEERRRGQNTHDKPYMVAYILPIERRMLAYLRATLHPAKALTKPLPLHRTVPPTPLPLPTQPITPPLAPHPTPALPLLADVPKTPEATLPAFTAMDASSCHHTLYPYLTTHTPAYTPFQGGQVLVPLLKTWLHSATFFPPTCDGF